MDIYPKIKNLLWRVCRGYSPYSVKLRERGVDVERGCGLCRREETIDHVLRDYSKAREVWRQSGLGVALYGDTFNNILLQILKSLETDKVQLFCCIVWALWSARNALLWERKEQTTQQVLGNAVCMIRDWRDCSVSNSSYAASIPSQRVASLPTWGSSDIAGW
ncbi:uncharacterized protein LOC105632431 [Jatropha curcas]|uniref:uncharacterized protein LOC105632431 n=1 Tax=Jatropha curcas TaxID=180498 RepID=UPI0005FB4ED4|nr:uncharacterized protein LOC105632431 [Jatropha curcas]